MLTAEEFEALVLSCLNRRPNKEQSVCISADPAYPLLIVAGPGTGKTTVMVLRALRHLLVDRIEPEGIVVTTFTRKAAQEVRTRWLDWGLPLVEAAKSHASLQSGDDQAWLERIDLNRCITGTLDSICETLLSEHRVPGTATPVLIEGYPANQKLLKAGLAKAYTESRSILEPYLSAFNFDGAPPSTQGEFVKIARVIVDRFTHDRVDIQNYRTSEPHAAAKELLAATYEEYCASLAQSSQLDFALLEFEFLNRLQTKGLDSAVSGWKALLVDEYQDTNPLQEAIYFEVMRRTGASLSVVGDDDQSLYRFRGATVELFTQFVSRLEAAVGVKARTEALFQNYRSTEEITTLFNTFIENEPGFAQARIQPPKPKIHAERGQIGLPVLGMFRKDAATLASDVASFLDDVFRKGGKSIPLADGSQTKLVCNSPGGDFGDAVVLAHSTAEYKRFKSESPKQMFPSMLRHELELRNVGVFNPRGQALSDQPSVQCFLGLLLECVDRSTTANPDGTLTPEVMGLTNLARARMLEWRVAAQAYIEADPAPGGLRTFVDAWHGRQSSTGPWPEEWPVLELAFKLVAWMPQFQHDPEHQIWLEAVSRSITQARLFSPYTGQILNASPQDVRSRSSVIRDILRPIAEGLVDVDEEVLQNVPRDRLAYMTIHQSKGLEFPLVIVDVSSGFATNHAKTAYARYPSAASTVACLEDDLAPFTEIGSARRKRTGLDRSFDDLMRLYYVAYSRAQTALLIIGHEKTIVTGNPVKTVASGWARNGSWSWHKSEKPQPTLANSVPVVLL